MNAPIPQQLLEGHDRSKFIGGSDMAAIYGLSPWRTPLDLYLDKRKPRAEDLNEERRKFFARRKRQEPVIAEMLADEYGVIVTRLSLDDNPNRYRDPEFPFLAAEIDFEFAMSESVRQAFAEREEFAAIPDGTICNGEIKTVHPFKASEWGEQGSEDVPIHYAAQIMHGLGVTKRPAALCAALFGLDNLLCFPIMPDAETIAAMRAKAVNFWIDHVQTGIPPEPVNTEDVLKLYASTRGRKAEVGNEIRAALNDIKFMKGEVKRLEEGIKHHEQQIALAVYRAWGLPDDDGMVAADVKDSALLVCDGQPIATWGRQRGSYLDQKRLKADQPKLVEDYTVEHFYRVLRAKKEI